MLTLGLSKLRHVVWGSLIWCTLLCRAVCISPREHRRSGSHCGAGEKRWCWVVMGFAPSPIAHAVPPTTASCHHAVQRASQEHQSWLTQRRGILTWWSKVAAGSLLVSFILKPSHAVSAGWQQMLVHKPHFTWAFTYAKGITPMGKKGNLPLENWPRS